MKLKIDVMGSTNFMQTKLHDHENGFLLALFEEPNRFDAYSSKQLCLEIIKSIEHSIEISKVEFDVNELKSTAINETIEERGNLMLKHKKLDPLPRLRP